MEARTLLVLYIAFQVSSIKGNNCTLGRTNVTGVSANPSPGLFIDLQTPASCSGLVMEWSVCYFNPRYFNTEEMVQDGLEIGLQVWRFATPENGTQVDEYVARVDIPQVTERFQCIRIPLPPRDHMSVVEGDVLGVAIPFDAVLPVVGNFLSQTQDLVRPELLQYSVVEEAKVSRNGGMILTNNVLHVTAEITACGNGDVRLAEGYIPSEGRVEICDHNSTWIVACDIGWDDTDAKVLCRELGFPGEGSRESRGTEFGVGSASQYIVDVNCTGDEARLVDCAHTIEPDCDRNNTAGAVCTYNDVTAIYFNGQFYQNNSIIDALSIDNHLTSPAFRNSLVCLTNRFPCCSGSDDGSWHSPNGSQLPVEVTGNFYQEYYSKQSVVLYRSLASSSSDGLFHCLITDRENTTQYMYIGIYSNGNGIPLVSDVTYERSSRTLICTSTGGPATSVTWSRDNTPLVVDGATYQHSQIITDTNTATYENRLRIVLHEISDGAYTCTVGNSRGSSSAQLIIGEASAVTTGAETTTTTTTTESAKEKSQVDSRVLGILAAVFGSLFGATLLALIAVTTVFVIWVVRNSKKKKKKQSYDIPLSGHRFTASTAHTAEEHVVRNTLCGNSMSSSMVQNTLYNETRENAYLEGIRYEEVEAETVENIAYECVVEHARLETDDSTATELGRSKPMVANGYSRLQLNGIDSKCPTGALPASQGRGDCAPPVHDNYSHLKYKY